MKYIQSALCALLLFSSFAFSNDEALILFNEGKALLETPQANEGRNKLQRAIALFKNDLKSDSTNFKSLFAIAKTYFYLEDDPNALKYFDEVIRFHPDTAASYYMKGVIFNYGNRRVEAKEQFEKALELSPKRADYWYEYGRTISILGDDSKALEAYSKAIAVDSTEIRAMYNSGVIYQQNGNNSKAEELYKQILSVDSTFVNAAYNLAQMFQLAQKHEESLKYFLQVYALAPTDWKTLSKVIQELEAIGKRDEAQKRIKELYRIKEKGDIKSLKEAEFFSREQFTVGDKKVLALEHFSLVGERALKNRFIVYDAKSGESLYTISLGSYDATNQIEKELGNLKKGERLYHLDGYYKDRHETYGFFHGQPEYHKIKALVIEVIEGKLKMISATQYK